MITGTRASVEVKVKFWDAVEWARRETLAERVLDCFGHDLPTSKLLCFLDDEDATDIKHQYGAANRGLYGPIHDTMPLAIFPGYVTDCILVDDYVSVPFPRVFDDVIYLHGSTCEDDASLIMTLSHELQHAVQHGRSRRIWAICSLVPNLSKATIQAMKLAWADIPTEREARIASKRVAVNLLGEQRVMAYIDQRIAARVTDADVADWQFVRAVPPSTSVDLVASTRELLARLEDHRQELEDVLDEKKEMNDPDFVDIDLSPYFQERQSIK